MKIKALAAGAIVVITLMTGACSEAPDSTLDTTEPSPLTSGSTPAENLQSPGVTPPPATGSATPGS